IKFKQLPAHLLPKSAAESPDESDVSPTTDASSLTSIVNRWRGVARQRSMVKKPTEDVRSPSIQPAPPLSSAERLDPDRFRLLKRPLQDSNLFEPKSKF